MLFAQPAETPKATVDASLLAEIAFWESVKESRNSEEFRAYVAEYPQGRFVSLARVRIKALTAEAGSGESTGIVDFPAAPAVLKAGDALQECDVCPQMVVIPAGSFEMGSDERAAEERPQHAVAISKAFAIGAYEVTVGEWDACFKEGGCRQAPESGRNAKMPIGNVSWDDAWNYVKWLSKKTGQKYRLPTEAEWEYAARAGAKTSYWWGDEKGDNRANCADCGTPWDSKDASPAGSFEPNPFGLYDIHGNLWEWVQDCWNSSYQNAPGDGGAWMRGDCLSRVLRGGGWALDHEYMRSSRRNRYDRDVRYYLNGFRVVRELPAPAVPAPVDGVLSFEAAVEKAANKVFSNAPKPAAGSARQSFVIDPLIDGLSGAESAATHAMESRIVELVRANYTQFDVRDFSASDASGSPYVVIGTFTGVNKQRKTSGVREGFRICLALLDLESGRVASKAKVFSQASGVDITPTLFFRESPVWIADPSIQALIKTCQATKPGDPIDPVYLERLRTADVINKAINAYEKGQYKKSQELFKSVAQFRGGNQLRTYNGLYLTSWKLGDRSQAAEAFGNIVDFGLQSGRFAVKFPFRPGSTDFVIDPNDAGEQDMWLAQIAAQTERREECLEIVGHTHRLGPELLNQRLSIRQAEYIKRRLEAKAPELNTRMIAAGRGSEENLIGSGTGDVKDVLDRRIEFDAMQCSSSKQESADP
ncbi:MAG: SUMF1/EgtB/PvdO family nonheme iron enzyme [Pseudomonadota bacterium]|nr:SUMF1/EgtB/PvdO family nonheme iron enzyme [Pseudomonadota bacterium]